MRQRKVARGWIEEVSWKKRTSRNAPRCTGTQPRPTFDRASLDLYANHVKQAERAALPPWKAGQGDVIEILSFFPISPIPFSFYSSARFILSRVPLCGVSSERAEMRTIKAWNAIKKKQRKKNKKKTRRKRESGPPQRVG